MPAGGKIAPDGRAPQAKGIGKNSKRHDLEQPATPGLSGTDLQSGDVQMLERGQQVAPRSKKTQQPSRTTSPQRGSTRNQTAPEGSDTPDPLEFAAGKIGGKDPSRGAPVRSVDTSQWLPLLRQMALAPNSGGALSANLMNILTAYNRRPMVSETVFLDMQELDNLIDGSI